MTDAQFAALAQLLRLRGGAAQEAARLVLVEGVAQAEAAGRLGITPASVSAAVKACRNGVELARRVCN